MGHLAYVAFYGIVTDMKTIRSLSSAAAFGLVCCFFGTIAQAEEGQTSRGLIGIVEAPADDLFQWTDPVLQAFAGRYDRPTSNPYREALGSGGGAEAPSENTAWLVGRESGSKNHSLEVVLSALLAAGCYHLVRHRHNLSITVLPPWYHDGGPFQVRHHVRYEFQNLDVCLFSAQESTQGEAPLRGVFWDAGELQRPSLVLCSSISLRGPPVL